MNPLVRALPPSMVRAFAARYVAGDSLASALDTAADLWLRHRRLSTLDLLAEDVADPQIASRNVRTYFDLIDAVADDRRFEPAARPTLSLKLSSFTDDPLDRGGTAAGSKESLFKISERARTNGVRLTTDMESSHWTDFTLDALSELHRDGHHHVGAVIQTRLHRSEKDLDRLPEGIRVRLVIGIYQEKGDIALTDKIQMKERLLSMGRTLLRRGHYVELGTHDRATITRFVDEVVPEVGVSRDQFEIQMLYGVPRRPILNKLTTAGITTRLYVPFALSWPMAIAYLRRRLNEYPTMVFLAAKNIVQARLFD